MRLLRPLCAAAFATASALASTASAQDSATAAALFERGLAEMNAGHHDTGCPALAESQRLDPRLGTVFTLAECEARWGRVASAYAHYDDYLLLFAQLSPAQQERQGERPRIAAAQKAALRPQIPELTLELPKGAPRGAVIKRDGTTLTEASLGIPLPLDPIEHVITTQAPGGPETEQRVTLAKGERKRLTLAVKPAPAPTPAPAAAPRPVVIYVPQGQAVRRSTGLMVAGIVIIPFGLLVTLVGGLTLGGCEGSSCKTSAGVLITGGVLLGGAIAATAYGSYPIVVPPAPVKPGQKVSWVPTVGLGPMSGSLRWSF